MPVPFFPTRSLWCGLRSSFLVAAPSRRSVVPTRLRTTPGLASSPLRDVLRRAASCHRAGSCGGHPGRRALRSLFMLEVCAVHSHFAALVRTSLSLGWLVASQRASSPIGSEGARSPRLAASCRRLRRLRVVAAFTTCANIEHKPVTQRPNLRRVAQTGASSSAPILPKSLLQSHSI